MLEILIVLVIALIVFGPMLLKARKNTDDQPFPVNDREVSDATTTRDNGGRFNGDGSDAPRRGGTLPLAD